MKGMSNLTFKLTTREQDSTIGTATYCKLGQLIEGIATVNSSTSVSVGSSSTAPKLTSQPKIDHRRPFTHLPCYQILITWIGRHLNIIFLFQINRFEDYNNLIKITAK